MKLKQFMLLLVIGVFLLSGCEASLSGETDLEGAVAERAETEENSEQTASDKQEEADGNSEKEPDSDSKEEDTETPAQTEDEKEKETIVAQVEYSDAGELDCLTSGALGAHFDYEIYYYGIKNFYITVDDQEIELRKALEKDPKVLDDLYAEWKGDHGEKYLYKDGGSVKYPYDLYTAYKLHALQSGSDKVNEDLVICCPGVSLDFVGDLIKKEEEKLPNPVKTIVKRVEQTDSRELELLTGGTIGETLDYEVYYCGIKNFYITVDDQEIELRKALVKYPNILDDLYAEWKQGVNHPYYDGGSVEYPRATYTAIKLKTTYLGETGYMQRMNDLIICATDMTLNKVDDLIEEIYAAKKPNLLTTPKLGKRYDSDDYVIDPGKDLINEATAIKIARQFFLDEYGAENAAAFSKVDCRFDKAGTYSEGRYHVVFYYPLGEGGFINGPSLTILISERGGVMQSFPSEGIKNFDLNLLEGWSMAKLKRKLMKQLTDRFGNKATDLTMESIRLEQNESGTYLHVDTDALIDWELSHDGHKGVYFSYHFETATWEEPTYCK